MSGGIISSVNQGPRCRGDGGGGGAACAPNIFRITKS